MKSKAFSLLISIILSITAPMVFANTVITFEGTIIGGAENIGKRYELIFSYDPIFAITDNSSGEKQYGGTNFSQVAPNVLTELVELRIDNILSGQYTGTFYNVNLIQRQIPGYDPNVSFNYLQTMILDANSATVAEAHINEAALITASELFSNPTFNQTGSYTVQTTPLTSDAYALYTNASWWGQGFGSIEKVSISTSSPVPLPSAMIFLFSGLISLLGLNSENYTKLKSIC
jgi:hypothetical protein